MIRKQELRGACALAEFFVDEERLRRRLSMGF
jgi:hypothetical protein